MEALNFIELIEYSINKIDKISSISEITTHWRNRINDITEARQKFFKEDVGLYGSFNMFIGQQNYFYNFVESNFLFGEFSIDLLPIDPQEYLNTEMSKLAEIKSNDKTIFFNNKMRIVNWRVQLFSQPDVSENIIDIKFSQVLQWITTKIGEKPNTKDSEMEFATNLGATCNQKINCWIFNTLEKTFIISIYKLKEKPSIAFSIMEGMEKPIYL